MKGVFWKQLFCELSVIIAIGKELDVLCESLHSSGKASRFASQAFEIMA